METIIKPTKGWQPLDIKELFRYKDLLYFMVLRGIKARYAQSVLGVGWAVIQPLFATGIFTVVFGRLAQIDSDGVPYSIFAFCALVPWGYFSATLTDASQSLVVNAGLLNKVYFPRIILPLSAAFSKLLDFSISFTILIFFLFFFQIKPGPQILVLPLLVVILLMTSLGTGMFLSALAVQYRDIKHASSFMIQLLLYAAPVVYPASKVPGEWMFYYSLNPMVGVIEGFRAAFLSTRPIPWDMISVGGVVGLILFLSGAMYFKRMERVFADVA
jgi:homopolymeric O-antigen transport system permease protein